VSYPQGDLRDQLGHVGAQVVSAGLVVGSGGNLSARQPGSDQCWITAANTWLQRLQPAEFSLISIPDGGLRGGHPKPSSEWRLHTETYARRPDINAIVHLHPQASVLLTALRYDIALIPFEQPGTVELAVAAADAVAGGVNAVVLGHHGCSVLADSVELAHKRAVNLEEAARATYAALLLTAGDPNRVPQVPVRFLEAAAGGEASV
jgi:L-fuculose-phosphate aldolase